MKLNGKVALITGGAEVVPHPECFMYISRGMVVLYHTTPAFYAGGCVNIMRLLPRWGGCNGTV
jgi:hypothetical protein